MILKIYSSFDLLQTDNEILNRSLEIELKNKIQNNLDFSQNLNKNLAISFLVWFFSDFKYFAGINFRIQGNLYN